MLKRKIFSIVTLCFGVPTAVVTGYYLLKIQQYLLLSLIIIAISLLPFFLSLERKKMQAREIVITASVVALAVASRAAFFYLPDVKPMCALLIIFASSFGAEFGFLTGALSMLLSNFIYGQGIWTPYQMLAMGITVFVCTLVFGAIRTKNRIVLGVVSAVIGFVVYGLIIDSGSVLMMLTEFSVKSVLSIFASGAIYNLIHGVTTGVCVALFYPLINEKTERIKQKYGLFGEKK